RARDARHQRFTPRGAAIAAAGGRRIPRCAALHPRRGRHRGRRRGDDAAYSRDFGLDAKRLKLASPDVLVMHPGPMNRGVEISSDVADGPRSVIREQVNNGVAVRMAALASIAPTLTPHRRPL